jgi:hypothetical protein
MMVLGLNIHETISSGPDRPMTAFVTGVEMFLERKKENRKPHQNTSTANTY